MFVFQLIQIAAYVYCSSILPLSQMYYVSSGLSFYFIYDFCLYHGMSAPVSYLLRYLPLCTALVTISTVMVIRYTFMSPISS